MEFIYLEDRSEDNIEELLQNFHIAEDQLERTIRVFSISPKLHLLRLNGNLTGFVYFKYMPDTKVVFCIIHTEIYSKEINPDVFINKIKEIYSQEEIRYCTFHDFYKGDIPRHMRAIQEPFDVFAGWELKISDFQENVMLPDVQFQLEDLEYEELLKLHLIAYSYEEGYVGENWENILEHFLTLPNHCIGTCRVKGELVGLCLGINDTEDHSLWSVCILPEYQGKQLGFHLMNNYFSFTRSKKYNLGVHYSNLPAMRLYEKLGFIETRTGNVVYQV